MSSNPDFLPSRCHNCGNFFRVAKENVGRPVRCPKCKKVQVPQFTDGPIPPKGFLSESVMSELLAAETGGEALKGEQKDEPIRPAGAPRRKAPTGFCPNCKIQVLDSATTCVHCGTAIGATQPFAPLGPKPGAGAGSPQMTPMLLIGGGLVALVVIVVVGLALNSGNSNKSEPAATGPVANPEPGPGKAPSVARQPAPQVIPESPSPAPTSAPEQAVSEPVAPAVTEPAPPVQTAIVTTVPDIEAAIAAATSAPDMAAVKKSPFQEMLDQADLELDNKKALDLYKQAAALDRKNVNVPLHKAHKLLRAGDMKGYGLALGEVLALDGSNVEALNNAGVLAAQANNYALAGRVAKAAMLSKNDTVISNFVLIVYLARYDQENGYTIIKEGYANYPMEAWKERAHRILAAMQTQVDPLLGSASLNGACAQVKASQAGNAQALKNIRNIIYEVRAQEARNDMVTQTASLRMQCYGLIYSLNVPPLPRSLFLIDENGNQSSQISVPDVTPMAPVAGELMVVPARDNMPMAPAPAGRGFRTIPPPPPPPIVR